MSYRKYEIIPITIYDRDRIRVVAEDEYHRYIVNDRGHIAKLPRKRCFLCPVSADFVILFNYKEHSKIERFCKEHASNYGELPEIPQQEYNLNDKQKSAIQAMQKWNDIKVII